MSANYGQTDTYGSGGGWGGYGRQNQYNQPGNGYAPQQWGGVRSSNGYGDQPVGQQNGANYWNTGGYSGPSNNPYGGGYNGYNGAYNAYQGGGGNSSPYNTSGYGAPGSGAPPAPWLGGQGDNYRQPYQTPTQQPPWRGGGRGEGPGGGGWGGYGRRHGHGGPPTAGPTDPTAPVQPTTAADPDQAYKDAVAKYQSTGNVQNADGTYGDKQALATIQAHMHSQQLQTPEGQAEAAYENAFQHAHPGEAMTGPGSSSWKAMLAAGATPQEAAQTALGYSDAHGGQESAFVQSHGAGENFNYGYNPKTHQYDGAMADGSGPGPSSYDIARTSPGFNPNDWDPVTKMRKGTGMANVPQGPGGSQAPIGPAAS